MQAFETAWAAACKVEASTIIVPAEFTFLVGPVSFSGPYCIKLMGLNFLSWMGQSLLQLTQALGVEAFCNGLNSLS